MPTLLPGGRPVADAAARAEVEAAWGLRRRAAARRAGPRHRRHPGRGGGRPSWPRCVVGGVDPHDLADPAAALAALREVGLPGQPGAAALARSPSSPTWCSRSPRTRSAPAATSTGRAGAARSARPWTPAACCRTAGCWTPWPSRWTSTCSPRPRPPRPASWPGSARVGRRRAAGRRGCPARPSRMRPGYGQAVLATWRQLIDDGSLAATSRTWPAPPARRWSGQRGHRGAARARRGRAGHGAHRAGRDHAAAGAGRPARRRGLAAGQLRRVPGPVRARRRARRLVGSR